MATRRSWSSSTTSRSPTSRRSWSRRGLRGRRRSWCAPTSKLGRELPHVLLERRVRGLDRAPRRGVPGLGLRGLVLGRPAGGVGKLLLERGHGGLGVSHRLLERRLLAHRVLRGALGGG